MNLNPRSLSFRFSLPYALVLGVLVGVLIAHNYGQSDQLLRKQLDETLRADTQALIEIYELGGLDLLSDILQKRLSQDTRTVMYYLLTDQEFRPVLGNMANWPTELSKTARFSEIDYYGRHQSDKDIRFLHTRLADGHHLLIGLETVQIEVLEDQTEFNSALYLGAVFLAALLSGLFLHLKLNRKLKLISANCQDIQSGDLSVRFPTRTKGDEIDEMSRTLNEMLDQIQGLMMDLQHITDNIAHDLRSPLTRVRNQLEGLAGEWEQTQQGEQISRSIEELDELLRTFNAMLRLTRIETGTAAQATQKVDLARILEDSLDLYEPIAEEKNQQLTLSLEGALTMAGDKNLLFQMISNVLDNAMKYSPPESDIIIKGERRADQCVITITDGGPGIDPSEFDQITKRFYRLDKSRHLKGNGLGLSFVQAIVHHHKGSLSFSNAPGLSVQMSFSGIKD